MAEIVLVMGAGRQQRDRRIVAAGAGEQFAMHGVEMRRKAQRARNHEQIARHARMHDAVGEREADAGDGLGMTVDHAPRAVRAARHVDGEIDETPASEIGAAERAQERRVAQNELRREMSRLQKFLFPVNIVEDRREQSGTLGDRAFQELPFIGRHDQRDEVDLPGLVRAVRLGKQILTDAVLAHEPPQILCAARLFCGQECPEALCESFPMLTNGTLVIDHLVETSAVRSIIREWISARRVDPFGHRHHFYNRDPYF